MEKKKERSNCGRFYVFLKSLFLHPNSAFSWNCNIQDVCKKKNIVPPKKRFYFLFYFLAFQILAPHYAAVSPTKLSHAGSSKLRCLQGHQEPLGPDGLQLQFNSSFIYLFKTNNFKAARTRSKCQGFNIFQNWTSFKRRWLIKTWGSQFIIIIIMMILSVSLVPSGERTDLGTDSCGGWWEQEVCLFVCSFF